MARHDHHERRHDDRDRRDRDKRGRDKSASPPHPRERDRDGRRRSPPSKRRREDDYESGRREGSRGSLGLRGEPPASGYSRRWRPDSAGAPYGRGQGYEGDDNVRGGGRGDAGWDDASARARDGTRQNGADAGGGLMTYKQFMASLEDDVTPDEAQRRYEDYKASETKRLKEVYFSQTKDQEWLKDKYHPNRLEIALKRRNETQQTLAKDFLKELDTGDMDFVEKNPKAPTVPAAAGEEKRVAHDIQQCLALVKKLDAEKGIEESRFYESTDAKTNDGAAQKPPLNFEGVSLLDALLTYLWRVHYADYYGALESKDGKGPRHVRAQKVEGKEEAEKAKGLAWEQKVDAKWQARLAGSDPLQAMLGQDKLDKGMDAELEENHVRRIKDEKYGWKYGCGAKGCTKLFHGAEFVLKHLKLKHGKELLDGVKAKVLEEVYMENYMNDLEAPFVPPASSRPPTSTPPVKKEGQRPPARIPVRERISGFDELPKSPPREFDEPPLDGPPNSREPLRGRLSRRPPYGGSPGRYDGRGSPGRGPPMDHDYVPGLRGGPPHFDERGPPLYDERGMPFEGGRRFPPFEDEYGPPDPRDVEGPPFEPPFGGGLGMRPPLLPHPQVLIPVEGAGPMGPFVPAPPEVAREILHRRGAGPHPPGPIFLPPDYDGPRRPPPGDFDGPGPEDHPQGPEMLPGRGRGERGPPHMMGRGGRGPRPFFGRGPPPHGGPMFGPPLMPLGPPPGVRHDPRGMREYVDLDAPADEVTVLDYRSL